MRRLINFETKEHHMTSVVANDPLGLTEKDLAAEIKVSVSWLQHDRITARIIPFYRIGKNIRYNRARVQAALVGLEEGGPSIRRRAVTA